MESQLASCLEAQLSLRMASSDLSDLFTTVSPAAYNESEGMDGAEGYTSLSTPAFITPKLPRGFPKAPVA